MVGQRQNNLSTSRAWGRQKFRKGSVINFEYDKPGKIDEEDKHNKYMAKTRSYSVLFITLAIPAMILYSPAAPFHVAFIISNTARQIPSHGIFKT